MNPAILLYLLLTSSFIAEAKMNAIITIHSSEAIVLLWNQQSVECPCGGMPNHISIIEDDIHARCDACVMCELSYDPDHKKIMDIFQEDGSLPAPFEEEELDEYLDRVTGEPSER
jgi:hypothetical protein